MFVDTEVNESPEAEAAAFHYFQESFHTSINCTHGNGILSLGKCLTKFWCFTGECGHLDLASPCFSFHPPQIHTYFIFQNTEKSTIFKVLLKKYVCILLGFSKSLLFGLLLARDLVHLESKKMYIYFSYINTYLAPLSLEP